MEPWVSKVISLILTFTVTLLSGLLPIKLIRVIRLKDGHTQRSGHAYRADVIFRYLNCFSGGVFLAVSLLHLLPDVRADLMDVLEALHQTSDFPLAEFIACIGFFVVMLLEHGIMQYQHSSKTAVTAKNGRPGESCSRPIKVVDTPPAVDDIQSEKSTSDTSSSISEEFLSISIISDTDSTQLVPSMHFDSDINGCETREGEDAERGIGADHTHHSHDLDPDDLRLHSMRSLVLLIALSTHMVFEGMALGLQNTTSKVWTLLTAIILHKAIMSLTAGLRFVKTLPSLRRTVLYIIFFSFTTPMGIAIGITVSESGTSGLATSIASSALQGVATGTFIYVTFFEVLLDEMSTNHKIAKVFAVILGFTCIAGLELVSGGMS